MFPSWCSTAHWQSELNNPDLKLSSTTEIWSGDKAFQQRVVERLDAIHRKNRKAARLPTGFDTVLDHSSVRDRQWALFFADNVMIRARNRAGNRKIGLGDPDKSRGARPSSQLSAGSVWRRPTD